jgi:hypothetical protein
MRFFTCFICLLGALLLCHNSWGQLAHNSQLANSNCRLKANRCRYVEGCASCPACAAEEAKAQQAKNAAWDQKDREVQARAQAKNDADYAALKARQAAADKSKPRTAELSYDGVPTNGTPAPSSTESLGQGVVPPPASSQTSQYLDAGANVVGAVVQGLEARAAEKRKQRAIELDKQIALEEKYRDEAAAYAIKAAKLIPGMEKMAEKGNVNAMISLYSLCANDKEKSQYWLEKAANSGSGYACWFLFIHTVATANPNNRLRDNRVTAEEGKWLQMGADAGDARCMYELSGSFYGEKFKKNKFYDNAKAIQWLVKAAEAGEPKAMSWLAHIYDGSSNNTLSEKKDLSKSEFYANMAKKTAVQFGKGFQLFGYGYDRNTNRLQITPLYLCKYRTTNPSSWDGDKSDARREILDMLFARHLVNVEIISESDVDKQARDDMSRKWDIMLLEAKAAGYEALTLDQWNFSYNSAAHK